MLYIQEILTKDFKEEEKIDLAKDMPIEGAKVLLEVPDELKPLIWEMSAVVACKEKFLKEDIKRGGEGDENTGLPSFNDLFSRIARRMEALKTFDATLRILREVFWLEIRREMIRQGKNPNDEFGLGLKSGYIVVAISREDVEKGSSFLSAIIATIKK